MKKEDFRYSFDMIKPDESARKRMLDNIMQYADKNAGKSDEIRTVKYRRVRFRIAIPVFVLTLLVAAGIVMYSIKWQNNESQLRVFGHCLRYGERRCACPVPQPVSDRRQALYPADR